MTKLSPIRVAVSLALGGVFAWAAVLKIADPGRFVQDIENFRILPASLLHPTAIVLPWIELLNAIFVIIGLWRREAAAVLSGLLVVFLVAVVSAIARGLSIQCGCFGPNSRAIGLLTIATDVALLAGALFLVILAPRAVPAAVAAGDRLNPSKNS